ncbi:MAG: PAS domain-containing protein, partial [Candidatus Aminicenantes bacterium]
MKDKNKTKKQLIEELSELRKRVTELEEAESERNNIEGKQKETEEQHKISTEFLSDGCLIVDLKGKVSDCNSAYLNHTGYSREDIVNKHFTKLPTLQKKDIPQYIKMFNSAIRGKFPKSMEYEWIHSDGTTRWGEAYFNIMRKKGRISGFNIITRDITERKRMEEHLRESEERYRAMFDQAPDSVVFIDGDTGAIVEYNERAYENLGYSREEFGRLKIPDYEALESAEEVSRHIKRIIRKGSDVFETKHRTKEGEIRDILVSSRAISFGGRDFVQSIWRDITEKKRLEEDLRESQQLLEKTFASLLDAVFIIDADTAKIMDC